MPKRPKPKIQTKLKKSAKEIGRFLASPAFMIRDHFITFLAIFTPIVAIISVILWFIHTYAMTPWELYQITRFGLPSLEGLEQLPGYLDVTDLPGYLEARKNTVDIIRDTMKEQNFEMYDLIQLAKCESTINPFAVNARSGATGLFQYLPRTWETTPQCHEDIYDAEAQTLATIWMFRHSRQREWECFRDRYYKLTEVPQPRNYSGCQ